jgi:hypothetical protein
MLSPSIKFLGLLLFATAVMHSAVARVQGESAVVSNSAVAPATATEVRLGDVMMRSLRVWPQPRNQNDTLATAKAFNVDRIVWIYENTQEFNEQVRAEGIGIGTTMSANAREIWLNSWPSEKIQPFIDRFTIKNLAGEQVLPPHMKKFGNAWVVHWLPDHTNPEWIDFYTDYVVGLYGKGIDAVHRDTAALNFSAPRAGGTFTDSAVEFFRSYLVENYSLEQLAALGVEDISDFNVRDHFKELGAPNDEQLTHWRGSPLMSIYIDAMMQADRLFFRQVRERVEAQTGLVIPWGLNAAGPVRAHEESFDFRIGEFQSHFNQPQTILYLNEMVRREGKIQAWVSMVDRNYESLPDFIPDTRRHIATVYAVGSIPLVPWCMYMHDAPRFYGSVEDFGDLFHFVSENRHYFDEHELIYATGMDTLSRLYSWHPNQELSYPSEEADVFIRLNQENIVAFARRHADTADTIVHLVDWNGQPEPFQLTLDPVLLTGSPFADLLLLRPGEDAITIPGYAGETIALPALDPWGILVVSAADAPADVLPAPRLKSPTLQVVPRNLAVIFADAGPDRRVMARLRVDDTSEEPAFKPVTEEGVRIVGDGWLDAYVVDSTANRESASVSLRFQTFQDLSVSEAALAKAQPVDVSNQLRAARGEIKVNGSFMADEMRLLGERVERGFSTQGEAVLSTRLNPDWRYFSVRVGIDDAEDRRPCARFQVIFDGELAYETPIINPTKLVMDDQERVVFPIAVRIPENAQTMRLQAVNGGFFPQQNTFIWAEPTMWLSR